tara:strand:- start:532 stop:711 length:180 start_codon:yes stop_codon:yes gene_type:complete
MNTVGPAINFFTSCWLLPQKEQYNVFFDLSLVDLIIIFEPYELYESKISICNKKKIILY